MEQLFLRRRIQCSLRPWVPLPATTPRPRSSASVITKATPGEVIDLYDSDSNSRPSTSLLDESEQAKTTLAKAGASGTAESSTG
ncbi:hypothetical protein HG530_014549 [Fusarium avenaceum]|nr:hypothetical protein HG530_014549 [Fusarium avenaceum]